MLDAGSLVISEFLAGNEQTLPDEDGDFSDWIEIHNPTDQSVSLDGWHLTDDDDDLTKWEFPDVALDAGAYLVVFASSKSRTDPASELHTSFSLNAGGEYLALVEPNGSTIAHQFSPEFPSQVDDVSYGITQDVTTFVAGGADLSYRIPTSADAAVEDLWMTPGFNDGGWTGGSGSGVRTGVGFNIRPTGFNVTCYIANIDVGSLDAAEDVIANPSRQTSATSEIADVIDYYNSGGMGHYGGNYTFPGITAGNDVNNFVVEVTATVLIPSPGAWTFGVNSDDGFSLELTNGIDTFTSSYPNPRGAGDTLAAFNFTQAGPYDLRLAFYERGGGSELELFAAPGSYGSFSPSAFDLVGDTANGGLTVTGFGGAVKTDVQAEMHNQNASLWTRIPFQVDDPTGLSSLQLRMMYNDGFVAYLNGQEIARRNAPTSLAWNSAATATRPYELSAVFEEINVTTHADQLVTGQNVLAIHGLNDAASDDSFLILPELLGSSTHDVQRYFSEPTPGGPNVFGGAGESFVDFVADTKFSVDRGFFDAPFQMEITTATPGATIRYTTDGSAPTENRGSIYTGPITISTTTSIRAAAFKADFEPTNVDTQTYIFVADVVRQPTNPAGFPSTWNGHTADYQMDPDVVNSPLYRDTIEDDLKSIPTISLVMDIADIFGSGGIYSNPNGSGTAWEKPGSVEFIQPDGTSEEFQVNAGIRIYGGVGRNAQFEKHTFRFLFKSDYGPTKLDFPLFGEDATDRFDTIILRAGFNNSWHRHNTGEEQRAQFIRDEWVRQTQLDMGQPGLHGTFVHLYINGLYWGLYNPVERANADYGSSYFGGEKEEYDALNSYPRNVVDGSADAWVMAQAIAGAGVADQAGYDALAQYVDIENLIDYMIVNFYGGNRDWDDHNWYSIRRRADGEGYMFFGWDSERTLESITGDNRTGVGQSNKPSYFYSALRSNPEFRMQFADRVQHHLFNDGALTPENAAARYEYWATFIDRAIVGESARWGDSSRATPYTRDAEWVAERDRLLNQYFPQRTNVVLSQLRSANLYPSIDAPVFNQHGGNVPEGFNLLMSGSGGTIYYTLDGSDPRLPGGGLSPTALQFDSDTETSTLIAAGSDWKYLDDGSNQGTAWYGTGFSDAGWASGPAQLGYGDGDEATAVSYGPNSSDKYRTTYFRRKFTVSDPSEFSQVTLRLLRDDGAVVYLNGQEIARSNMPGGAIDYLTGSASTVGGGDETTFFSYMIDPALLSPGENVIAVEVHQTSGTSSDISFDLQLKAVSTSTATPTSLNESVLLRARALDGNEWSALNEAQFVVGVPAAAGNLSISEINYHPHDPTEAELATQPTGDVDFTAGDFEFIELSNTSDEVIDLAGVRFTEGIAFDFTTGSVTKLAPGEYVVVVKDADAFHARYGTQVDGHPIPVAGEYPNSLDNGGEQLLLVDYQDDAILDFQYNDSGSWPGRADGKGSSLESLDLAGDFNDADFNNSENWRSSTEYGGTPGAAGSGWIGDVLINEVLSHTDNPLSDSIELYNATDSDINIGGWYLSDSSGNYLKYPIESDTVLPADGYLVFTEENHFNRTPLDPGLNDFALDGAHGDDVWLVEPDALGNPMRFVDHVEFGAAKNGESFGRYPNAQGDVYPMASRTFGTANSGPRIGPVLISEVMYHPTDLAPTANPDDFEFVEIHNPTSGTIDLTNWQLDKGVDYQFPTGLTLASAGTLVVVPFATTNTVRLSAFRSHYGIDASVTIVGPYSGKLSDSGERVQLQRPDQPPADESDFYPAMLEDEVDYGVIAPWPELAADSGHSLQRLGADRWGNNPGGWALAAATPGAVSLTTVATVVDRHIFYNASYFDGGNPAVNASDDQAIAIDKTALLPGQKASLANYTSYPLGINGVMVDMAGLTDGYVPVAEDFLFHVGNDNNPDSWTPVAMPMEINVRSGAGTDTSDRVTLTWPAGTIQNKWLRITVLAGAANDVFYFGNAVGESGDTAFNDATAHALVNATDEIYARNNQHGPFDTADVDDLYDFNRDRLVNATDQIIARSSQTSPFSALRLITVSLDAVSLDNGTASPAPPDSDSADATFGGEDSRSGTIQWPSIIGRRAAWIYDLGQPLSSGEAADPTLTQRAVDRLLASYF